VTATNLPAAGVIACGSPGIYALTPATCRACNTHGDHIMNWGGMACGTDWHCLGCRVTEMDGYLMAPTEDRIAFYDDVHVNWLLPLDLYEAYVDLDSGHEPGDVLDDPAVWLAFTPSTLARARRYDDVTAAVTAMGEGVVVTSDASRVVAFHESHLPMMERLAALRS
jgi:hypothetical protein